MAPKFRSPTMDIIRSFALLCVVCVHFFLHTGFYETVIAGPEMYIFVLIRSFFMVSSPLFIVLSGYLMKNKRPTRDYFLKIIKTIVLYLLASLCCIVASDLFSFFWSTESSSLVRQIAGILRFETAPYSWYLEMYLGLFFLIPYLNLAYSQLPSKKSKQFLILVLFTMTAIPSITNIYRLTDPSWWLNPASNNQYHAIFPDWWEGIFPITYYFIGSYLSEYPPKLKASTNLLLLALVSLAAGTFSYYRSYNSFFVMGAWQEWGSVFITLQTTLIFIFFLNRDFSRLKEKTIKLFARISELTLGAYLVSWIFDEICYHFLNTYEPAIYRKLPYALLTIPVVYICSLILSAILNWVYQFLEEHILARSIAKIVNRTEIPDATEMN